MDTSGLENLHEELESIKRRNTSVEADKAWETSAFRIGSICAITYVVAAIAPYMAPATE